MSHIPISHTEKDNRCRPFHRTITVLIIIWIISEFPSLFAPIVRFLLLYGLWVCGSKFYFSDTPRKRLRKFMHANAVWFTAPCYWNHTQFNSAWRRFISQTKKVFNIRADWSDVMAAVVLSASMLDCVWNVMAHAQKPDFFFLRNGRVHLNRQGRQFSRLLAAEVCPSAAVMVGMLDTPCSPVSHSLPLPCVTVCHHISTGL